MKDTTLDSLKGRHNRSITPPPDIVKKRQQQQAPNQAGNLAATLNMCVIMKMSANNVKLNLAVGLNHMKKVTDNPQVNTGYVVSLGSGLQEDKGQDTMTNEERHDTRPSYAEHPNPYPHPHRSDRAPSDDSRRSRNSSRDDDFGRLRYVQSDRSRRFPSPQDYRRETWRISRHEDRHDTRPRYEQHAHAHTSDRAQSDDSRISQNSDREDESRKPRNVHSDCACSNDDRQRHRDVVWECRTRDEDSGSARHANRKRHEEVDRSISRRRDIEHSTFLSEREDIRERSVGQPELESMEVPRQFYGSSRPVRLYAAQNIPERLQNINERLGIKCRNEPSDSPKVTQPNSKKLRRSVHDPNRDNSPVCVRLAENTDEDAETSPVIVTSRRIVSQTRQTAAIMIFAAVFGEWYRRPPVSSKHLKREMLM